MALISTANSISPGTGLWGTHLLCPAGKLNAISSGIWDGIISYTSELEAEQQETTEAQNPLDIKGGDKQKSFAINIEANKLATGQDPLTIYTAWVVDIGKAAPFFVGAVPIDASLYRLKSVSLRYQNKDIDADGKAYRADIELEFIEDTIQRVQAKGVEDVENATETTPKKTASKVAPTKAAKKDAAWIFR